MEPQCQLLHQGFPCCWGCLLTHCPCADPQTPHVSATSSPANQPLTFSEAHLLEKKNPFLGGHSGSSQDKHPVSTTPWLPLLLLQGEPSHFVLRTFCHLLVSGETWLAPSATPLSRSHLFSQIHLHTQPCPQEKHPHLKFLPFDWITSVDLLCCHLLSLLVT